MGAGRSLARTLGPADAVVIGVGSMIGAGVFTVFAPAAGVAGAGLLVGLVIAGVVAFCNATSSAQLAAQFPTSGGTYAYGREMIGPWAGFLAGWSFVVGKTASCAAMALAFAAYVAPPGYGAPVAVTAVWALAAVNCVGVSRTARLTAAIVVVVLAVLLIALIVGVTDAPGLHAPRVGDAGGTGWYGVVQSAGLVFFAFAGYARIATLGEEVRDPQRTIPRAVVIALSVAFVVYAAVGVTLLLTLGVDRLAASSAPILDMVESSAWAGPVVRIGAAAATLGALLALIAGVGRTSLAMARRHDLPRYLAAVHPRYRVPHRAELTVAAVVTILVLTLDVRGAVGFSSFGVLLYYAVAGVSAFRQSRGHRRYPRGLQVVGIAGCLLLVATLPVTSVAAGVSVLVVGVAYRVVRMRVQSPPMTGRTTGSP